MADTGALLGALATNMGDALGAMTGTAVRTMPAAGDVTVDWQVPVQVGGQAVGTVWMGLTHAGATQLVAAILGDPSLVGEADIIDTLKELVGQGAGAYVHGAGKGLTLAVDAPAPATAPVLVDAQHFDVIVGTAEPIRVVGWGRTVATAPVESPRPAVAAPAMTAPPPAVAGPAAAPRNLDVVLDIELPITVRFGETQMSLESLARLGPGSMIDLERAPDDPVDLLVNGRLIARGQVVVVSGCYGVRVNEVVSAADRLRSLEL